MHGLRQLVDDKVCKLSTNLLQVDREILLSTLVLKLCVNKL